MKDTGGPAFPRGPFDVNDYTGDGAEGMTLRDYFAAKAMQAWLSTFIDSPHPSVNGKCGASAAYAYEMADAMLEARDK